MELLEHILSYSKSDGLWIHPTFGYSIPRRNGKNEIDLMVEAWGVLNGYRVLHTAHRVTTSSSAFERLYNLFTNCGYIEGGRGKGPRDEDGKAMEGYDPDFKATWQKGMETLSVYPKWGKGSASFRTRTAKGGLGEGFDILIIDEAQDYTDDQRTSLQYVVTDSKNPLTLLMGTPPTAVSVGTVFPKLRNEILKEKRKDSGWAEWGVEAMTDVHDRKAWYIANPSLGYHITERAIENEINGDDIDFNIQRLGLWIEYNQASAITEKEWDALQVPDRPPLKGKLYVGIKYGKDGTNVSLSIACNTKDGKVFIECIDCKSVREGNGWITAFLSKADIAKTAVDGDNGKMILADAMKMARFKRPIFPTYKEVVQAGAIFESQMQGMNVCHMGQPSLKASATNCEKRAIGSNGGFGYKSLRDDIDVTLLESAVLAVWLCIEDRDKPKAKMTV